MKLVKVSIAFAVLVAMGFVYFRSPPSAPAPVATTQTPPADWGAQVLAAQVDRLQRELDALKGRYGAQQRASAVQKAQPPNEVRTDSDVEGSADDARALRAADLEQHREYMSDIAQTFTSERIDNVWALQTSSRINAAFDDHPALRQLGHNIECRAQTCRVSVEDDGSGSISTRLPALALSVVDVLPSISAERVDQGNGRTAMVLYMSAQNPAPAVRPTK